MVNLAKSSAGKYSCSIDPGSLAHTYYNAFYFYYDITVYSYLPLSAMSVLNALIIAKLVAAKLHVKDGNTSAGGTTMSKVSDSVTVMLVAVCVLFAVSTTPYAVIYGNNTDKTTVKYAIMAQCFYVNHSANIFVYLIFNKRFRAECSKLVCFNSPKVGPAGDTSSVGQTDEQAMNGTNTTNA